MSEPTPPTAEPPTEPAAEQQPTESPPPRKKRSKAWKTAKDWGLMLVVVGVLFFAMGKIQAPSLPDQAPEFTLMDIDGVPVSLSDYRGRTVVLNFWATWCAPCRVEIPSFSRFARNHPEMTVLGIGANEPAGKLKGAAKRFGIDYRVLVGGREILEQYNISAYPTTVVVGPEGEVRSAHAGMMFRPQLWWATR